jgi:hypothetical protein
MSVTVTAAGIVTLLLGAGHTLVGRVWIIEQLPRDLKPTPFGDGTLTRNAVTFTFHVVSLMLAMIGTLLLVIGQGDADNSRRAVLLAVGALFASTTLLEVWVTRRRPSDLLRAPIWIGFVAIVALCWLNA